MNYFQGRVKIDKLFDFLMKEAKIVEPAAKEEKKAPAKKAAKKKEDK